LIFLWVYYCKTYSVDSNRTFSMVRLFRASSYSKYNTNYRLFLELQCMFLFGPRDLVPCVRRGGLLTSWLSRFKLSPTTQFPRFVFWTVSPLRLLNESYLQFDHGQTNSIVSNALVYFKFSCNWRVYNVNIAFVVLISWWFQGFLWFL
jgi:hypothetical protein